MQSSHGWVSQLFNSPGPSRRIRRPGVFRARCLLARSNMVGARWPLPSGPASAIFFLLGALAQLGERRLCKPEVRGSTPLRSTRRKSFGNHTFCYLPVVESAAPICRSQNGAYRFVFSIILEGPQTPCRDSIFTFTLETVLPTNGNGRLSLTIDTLVDSWGMGLRCGMLVLLKPGGCDMLTLTVY